jgi:hypothetical protein
MAIVLTAVLLGIGGLLLIALVVRGMSPFFVPPIVRRWPRPPVWPPTTPVTSRAGPRTTDGESRHMASTVHPDT